MGWPMGPGPGFVHTRAPAPQRSWVRFPFKPEFFQVSSFQPLRLKHLHCDDLHAILSLAAVRIYEFHILIFKKSLSCVVLMTKLVSYFRSSSSSSSKTLFKHGKSSVN